MKKTAAQTSESLKSMHVRQVAPTEMVEKVEMNFAMLTAGVEERARRPPGLSSNSVYDDRHRHQQACWRTLHRRSQQE